MTAVNIFKHARQTPDKIALVYNGVSYSYANFARRIMAARQHLAAQEVPVNAVAVIDARSLFAGWVIGTALRSLGLTTMATRDPNEITGLNVGNIGCVVAPADESHTAPERGSTDFPWRFVQVPSCPESDPQHASLPDFPETTGAPGNHILTTSGTTGVYKNVMRDAVMEAATLQTAAETIGITNQSVVYVGDFGLWTAGGYRWPRFTWCVGGTVVIHQAPDLDTPLARHDLSHIITMPNRLAVILRAPSDTLRRNDATRLLVTGGALPKAMLEAAKRALTRQVSSLLASTEASTIAVTPLEQPDDLLWHHIHPSREVQVVDEADKVLGPGREGLVRVRIIDGLSGYLDDEAATREFFRDGYFYPGDSGMFRADGRLSLRGRTSDVINLLGRKIATGPIEQALQDRLGAEGVCILTIQNANDEDETLVLIQSRRPIARAEIEAARNAELSLLRRASMRVTLIETLPRNEMGKIRRYELRQQLALSGRTRLLHAAPADPRPSS